jgi:hypothetical protein
MSAFGGAEGDGSSVGCGCGTQAAGGADSASPVLTMQQAQQAQAQTYHAPQQPPLDRSTTGSVAAPAGVMAAAVAAAGIVARGAAAAGGGGSASSAAHTLRGAVVLVRPGMHDRISALAFPAPPDSSSAGVCVWWAVGDTLEFYSGLTQSTTSFAPSPSHQPALSSMATFHGVAGLGGGMRVHSRVLGARTRDERGAISAIAVDADGNVWAGTTRGIILMRRRRHWEQVMRCLLDAVRRCEASQPSHCCCCHHECLLLSPAAAIFVAVAPAAASTYATCMHECAALV